MAQLYSHIILSTTGVRPPCAVCGRPHFLFYHLSKHLATNFQICAHSTAAKRRLCSAAWRQGEGRSRIRDKRSKKQAVWHWCDVTLGINRKHKFSFSVTRKCWCGCLMRGNYHRSGGAPHSKHGNMLPTNNTRPGLLCVVSSFLSFNSMSFNDFPLSWI